MLLALGDDDGMAVGLDEGYCDRVGGEDGENEGTLLIEGAGVGEFEGKLVGSKVGEVVGSVVGIEVGGDVEGSVGIELGRVVSSSVARDVDLFVAFGSYLCDGVLDDINVEDFVEEFVCANY